MEIIVHHNDITEEAKLLHNLIITKNSQNQIADYVFKKHPSLDKEGITEEEIVVYLKDYYANKNDEIKDYVKRLNDTWCGFEDKVMGVFCDIFSLSSEDLPEADGYACSIDIFPRDVDYKVFFYGTHLPLEITLVTTVHEYTHFLYFDQWRKQYPEDFPSIDSPPHKLWQASEIMAIVITLDKRFVDLIPKLEDQDFNYHGRDYSSIFIDSREKSISDLYKNLYDPKSSKSISQLITDIRELTFSISDEVWYSH